jgi:ClpP class serine protease
VKKRAKFLPRHGAVYAVASWAWGMEFDAVDATRGFETCGTTAVVTITGPIAHTVSDDCDWDTYEAIKGRVGAALKSSATSVVLRINSPGGDALGCFEAAREIRAMASAARKPLYAYADGSIASAAYALASAATKIYAPPAGFVGSIGVMRALVDTTALDRAMGLNFVLVASGARKLDGNPHIAVSDSAIADTQSQVDSLAELFFALVSEMRGVPADHIRDLQAAMFHGEKAVSAKLADGVTTFNELLAMVAGGQTKALAGSSAESGMNYKELRAAFEKMAEGDGEDADKAKKALAAMDNEEPAKAEAPPPAPEKKKDEEPAKAEAPPPAPEKKKDEEEGAKALVSLTARMHAMEAERAQEKEQVEREKLFAQRPDFSAETKATLAKAPITMLREAVAKWPRIAGGPAAAATVTGTRGASDVGDGAGTSQLAANEKAELDERHGTRRAGGKDRSRG